MVKTIQLNNNYTPIHDLGNIEVVVDPAYWYDINLKINGYDVEKVILIDTTFYETHSSNVVNGIARFDISKFNKYIWLDLIAITNDNRNVFTMCNFYYTSDGISRLLPPKRVIANYNTFSNITNLIGEFNEISE